MLLMNHKGDYLICKILKVFYHGYLFFETHMSITDALYTISSSPVSRKSNLKQRLSNINDNQRALLNLIVHKLAVCVVRRVMPQ